MSLLDEFKNNLAKEREARGLKKPEARSVARMIKQFRDIFPVRSGDTMPTPNEAPKRTNVVVERLDGKPLVFFNDGSLRHALIQKPAGVSARQWKKSIKAARRRVKEAK